MPKYCKTHAIPDSKLCELMHAGIIEIVDGLTAPRVFVRGRERKPQLNEQGGRYRIFGGARYRVEIRYCGKRRQITRNRIVWLWYFGEIPDGADIHHGEHGKLCDGLINLDSLSEDDHKAFHYGENVNGDF